MTRTVGSPKGAIVRTLRDGETPPAGVTPRKYLSAQGYVRLRWRVGPYELVECYEHRFVTGAQPGQQVHHRNRIRSDNRLTNLAVVTPAEHSEEHAKVPIADLIAAYEAGASTLEVGERFGMDASGIYRRLTNAGVEMRGISESLMLPIPTDVVERLHRAGVRSRRIAAALGVSAVVIDRRIALLGLVPHREGRPTDTEITTARAALAAEGLL